MESHNSKRKIEDETLSESDRKKIHKELTFSRSEIEAESTLLDDPNKTEEIDKFVEDEGDSKEDGSDESITSLVDTIVTCVNNLDDNTSRTESLVESLKKELAIKKEEVTKLKELNRELSEKVRTADKQREEDKQKITKYKKAIIKLNQIAQVKETLTSTLTTTHQESEKMEDNSKEVIEEEKEKEESHKERRKCRYEDKGKCRERDNCKFYHPRGTCKTFSSEGYCRRGWKCHFRHPNGVCHQWKNTGRCSRGHRCIFRHPGELLQNRNFLGTPSMINQPPTVQRVKKDQIPSPMIMSLPTTTMNFPPHLFSFPPPNVTREMNQRTQ